MPNMLSSWNKVIIIIIIIIIKWQKEVKPLLYFLIELIQNTNFLTD